MNELVKKMNVVEKKANASESKTKEWSRELAIVKDLADEREDRIRGLELNALIADQNDNLIKVAKELAAFDQNTGWVKMAAKLEELRKASEAVAGKYRKDV